MLDVNKLAAASIIANQKVLFLRRLADAREESGLPDDESLDYLLTHLLVGIHIRVRNSCGGADRPALREASEIHRAEIFLRDPFWLQAERFPVHPLAEPDAEQRAMNVYREPNQDYQLVRGGSARPFVTVLDAFSRMLPLVDPSYVKNHSLQHNVPLIEAGIPRWLPAEIADRLTLDAK